MVAYLAALTFLTALIILLTKIPQPSSLAKKQKNTSSGGYGIKI